MKCRFWMLMFCLMTARAWGADSPRTVEELARIWEQWTPHTKSVEVEGFLFQGGTTEGATSVKRDEIIQLLENLKELHDSDEDPQIEDVRSITESVFPFENNSKRSTGSWTPIHLIIDGDKSRIDRTYEMPPNMPKDFDPKLYPKSFTRTVSRVDGKEVEYHSFNKQITVSQKPGGYWMPTISHFVLMIGNLDKNPWSWESLPDHSSRFFGTNAKGDQILFESGEIPGFIRRWKVAHQGFVNEQLQYAPLQLESGVVMARLCCRTYFRVDGELAMIEIALVKAAQIGAAIPSSRFHVEAPVGTLVVKYPQFDERYVAHSQGGPRPPMEKLTTNHPNAMDLVEEKSFGGPIPQSLHPPLQPVSHRLLIINGVGLLGILAYLYFRWKKNRKLL